MEDETPVGYERVYYTNSQGQRASRVQRVQGNYSGLFPNEEAQRRWQNREGEFAEPARADTKQPRAPTPAVAPTSQYEAALRWPAYIALAAAVAVILLVIADTR